MTNGSFTFNNVALAIGPNSFVVRLRTDPERNSSTFTKPSPGYRTPDRGEPDRQPDRDGGRFGPDVRPLQRVHHLEEVVRMGVTYPTGQTGFIDINLFATQAPNTVANFLAYVNNSIAAGSYNGSIFDRLVTGFVLQGGAFQFNPSGTNTSTIFPAITPMAPIAGEPSVANTLGTIAMALSGTTNNTATDAFFFNLADNSTNLDQQNGGFTVFGQVMDTGLQTLKTIGALGTYGGSGQPGVGPFPVGPNANTTNFPTNITASDLVKVTTVLAATPGAAVGPTAWSASARRTLCRRASAVRR